jgi:hypothetical protein
MPSPIVRILTAAVRANPVLTATIVLEIGIIAVQALTRRRSDWAPTKPNGILALLSGPRTKSAAKRKTKRARSKIRSKAA